VELDNWGVSKHPGEAGQGGDWVWGYDEISWFANQSRQYRSQWLHYALNWVRKTDPDGYLGMPGSRTEVSPLNHRWYFANAPTAKSRTVSTMKKRFETSGGAIEFRYQSPCSRKRV
jgi:hypothetical protein